MELELKNITRIFRTSDVETTAVNRISLKINSAEFVSLMGPSGCGKSTLLHLLGLIDSPTSGSYVLDGNEVANCSARESSLLRMKHIGFVFQDFNLIDDLTVYENVELPLIYNRTPSSERERAVHEVLERVNMTHRAAHFPMQLSGGQQQRVAIARAIVNKPDFILADEPTGNLDRQHGNEVLDLLSQLNNEGSTIVMVTHSDHDSTFASRVIHLLDGEINFVGTAGPHD